MKFKNMFLVCSYLSRLIARVLKMDGGGGRKKKKPHELSFFRFLRAVRLVLMRIYVFKYLLAVKKTSSMESFFKP